MFRKKHKPVETIDLTRGELFDVLDVSFGSVLEDFGMNPFPVTEVTVTVRGAAPSKVLRDRFLVPDLKYTLGREDEAVTTDA